MAVWPIKDAKSRFRELLEDARSSGPQIITHHGRERAVVLSITEYRALAATRTDLKAYLLGGPKVDDFAVEHDQDTGRNITF